MRIILCDPGHLFADSLRTALTAAGHRHATVASVPVPSDDPAVYVMDIADAALLMKLVSGQPRPAVVVMTDREDGYVLREAVDIGATGLVSTQSTVADVVSAIERVINGEPHYDPRLLRAALAGQVWLTDKQAQRLAAQLTPRERQVLAHIVRGDSTEAMGRSLRVSTTTVRSHVQKIMAKLGVHSRLAAAAFALAHHIEPPSSKTDQT
jgi:DNA-binding NarL/FixJ family response regulator